MTREERIRNLHLSSNEESVFESIYKQYESDEQIRGEKEKALQWRLEHLIPKSQLLLENRYSPRQDIKCLFVLVGTTVEPLLLSILTIRPSEKLVLIYSSESEKQKKIIENTLFQCPGKNLIQKKWLCGDNAKTFIEQVKNKIISIDEAPIKNTTPEKVFAEIKSRIGSFQENDIGVDITGGKKSMVGGGFLAASINNYHLFYVDFDEYKDHQPVQGTEFIHILPNPYDIYNIREESLIQKFWERQDFDAIIELICETLVVKLTKFKAIDYGLEKERNRLIQLYCAAQCYKEWSMFNYYLANEFQKISYAYSFDCYLLNHQKILSLLSTCMAVRKTAIGTILLSIDRWTRGKDAFDLNDFNKSALHFTQTIEVLCEFRLFDMTQKYKVSPQFEIGEIHFDVSALINFLWNNKDSKNIIEELAVKKNIAFTWQYVERFSKDKKPSAGDLLDKLSIRNNLAHFNCFDENNNNENKINIEKLKKTVKTLIELFITTYQNETGLKEKTFDDLKAQFEFARFADFNNSN